MKKFIVKIIATGFILGAAAFGVSQVDIQKSADLDQDIQYKQAYDPGDGVRP
ncbi:hypothetical protein [Niallia sp. FSL M8-0099]|uniref:hypothetical protein n=1 Tax=Niallia sp. FSL M8-0099 TaxID=2954519 RepID=UPI0030FC0F53